MRSTELFGNRFWSTTPNMADYKILCNIASGQCNKIGDTAMGAHPCLYIDCIILQPRGIKYSSFLFRHRFPFCMRSSKFFNTRFLRAATFTLTLLTIWVVSFPAFNLYPHTTFLLRPPLRLPKLHA